VLPVPAVVAGLFALLAAIGCTPESTARARNAHRAENPPAKPSGGGAKPEMGLASYYADRFAGRKTASGDRYRPGKLTAAHRTLPFGTIVEVSRRSEGETLTVRVRINDRGPFRKGRIIDLSRAAAQKLRMIRAGVAPVTVRLVRKPS